MTYDQAKQQARANADFFRRPYYVVTSTTGYRVERDPPSALNADRILFIAQPIKQAES